MTSRSHSIEVSEESGVRYLHFGSEWVQGAMRVARPAALELEYTRDMAVLLAARAAQVPAAKILQVGLGAASLTKHIAVAYPETSQTVVEINPQVFAVAQASFKLLLNERIDLQISDATVWLREASPRTKFDCIMVDGYDQHARFGALGTRQFYLDCRDHLRRNGALILNLFGRSRGYRAQIESLEALFDGRVLALPAIEGGNAVALAVQGAPLALDLAAIDHAAEAAGIAAKHRAASLQRLRVATGGRGEL